MDVSGLSPEQQALFASIMGNSPQAGGGATFSASQVAPAASPAAGAPAAAPAAAAPAASDPGKMLSQSEIDALFTSIA